MDIEKDLVTVNDADLIVIFCQPLNPEVCPRAIENLYQSTLWKGNRPEPMGSLHHTCLCSQKKKSI